MLGKASPVPPAELVAPPSEVCCPAPRWIHETVAAAWHLVGSPSQHSLSPLLLLSPLGQVLQVLPFFPIDDKCL